MSVLAPLLRPASWRLLPGAADVPWLRHLGLALLLASALALVAWSVTIWLDAWRLRSLGWPAMLAVPLFVLGLFHVWRLGCTWLRPGAALTLRWTGPIDTLRSGEPAGGWRVDEWGGRLVDVNLIWDWQRVMLLRVQPWDRASRQAWIWLQDRPGQLDREVHRLRTLLCLPAAMTRPGAVASAGAGLMASSGHEAPAVASARMNGHRNSSRVKRPERPVRPSRSRSHNGASDEPLRLEDGFAATQVLERWPDEAAEQTASIGGRP